MIDVETVRRLNNDDVDSLVRVLELNEDRIYAWMVEGSITVVREDRGSSIKYLRELRDVIGGRETVGIGTAFGVGGRSGSSRLTKCFFRAGRRVALVKNTMRGRHCKYFPTDAGDSPSRK